MGFAVSAAALVTPTYNRAVSSATLHEASTRSAISASHTQFLYSPQSNNLHLPPNAEQSSSHGHGTSYDAGHGARSLYLLADHAVAGQPAHQARNRSICMNSYSSTLDPESPLAVRRSKKKLEQEVEQEADMACRQRHLKCNEIHPTRTNCATSKRERCWNHEI